MFASQTGSEPGKVAIHRALDVPFLNFPQCHPERLAEGSAVAPGAYRFTLQA
jgi:hypothetical protein